MWSRICSSSKHSKFLIVIQPLFALARGLPSLLVTRRAGTAERDRILLRPACPGLVASLVFSGPSPFTMYCMSVHLLCTVCSLLPPANKHVVCFFTLQSRKFGCNFVPSSSPLVLIQFSRPALSKLGLAMDLERELEAVIRRVQLYSAQTRTPCVQGIRSEATCS